MKKQPTLNPMLFVKDEKSPEFRAHIIRRAKEAADPKNRLPISDLKKRLARYNGNTANA
jgi:5'-3' exonuclease